MKGKRSLSSILSMLTLACGTCLIVCWIGFGFWNRITAVRVVLSAGQRAGRREGREERRDGQTRETRRDNEELYKTHESIVVMIPTRSHYVPYLHLHLHSRARPVLRPERALCGRCLRSWYVLERRALALCPLLGLARSFARLLVRSFARSLVRSLVRPHSLTRSPRSSAVIGIDLYALISTDVRPPF